MNPDGTRIITRITLSPEERNLVLGHAGIGPELAQRLRFGTLKGQLIEYGFDEDLFGEPMAMLAYEGAGSATRAIRRRFQRLEKEAGSAVRSA